MTGPLSKIMGDTLKLSKIKHFCNKSEQKPLMQFFITQEMELEQFFLTASVICFIIWTGMRFLALQLIPVFVPFQGLS